MSQILSKKHYLHLLLLSVIVSVSFISTTSQASVTAFVDKTEVPINSVITMTLQSTANNSSQPDFSDLYLNFTILSTHKSSQYRLINGKKSFLNQWVLSLSPNKSGSLTIPAITIGNKTSQPITINITDHQQSDTTIPEPLFIRSTISKNSVYIQQETILTIKVFYNTELQGQSSLSNLDIDHSLLQQLGDTKSYQLSLDGILYSVFEISYSIHPQKTGTIDIPSQTFTGNIVVEDGFNNSYFKVHRTKPIHVKSESMKLEVLPVPTTYPKSKETWLPATNFILKESWNQPLDNIQVGDSITRTISIKATGLTTAQIPLIFSPSINGIKLYPEQPDLYDLASDNGIIAKYTQTIALVPTQAGTISLPEISYTWFDLISQKVKTSRIEAKELSIIAKTLVNEQNTDDSTDQKSNHFTANQKQEDSVHIGYKQAVQHKNFWMISTIILALLWILTIPILLFKQNLAFIPKSIITIIKKSKLSFDFNTPIDEKQAYKLLTRSSQSSNIQQIKHNFLNWASFHMPEGSSGSLKAAADYFKNNDLKIALSNLENSLYSKQSTKSTTSIFNAEEFIGIINKIRNPLKRNKKQEDSILKEINKHF